MRAAVLLIVALAMAALVSAESDAFTPGEVAVLTSDNFDAFIAEHKFVLVEFYAPWCGHCKKLEPEYAKAAAALAEDADVALAKVDATEHEDLAKRFNVRGFPTLVWMREGTTSPYSGPREADGIVEWVRSHQGPAFVEIGTEEELAEFREANSVHVLGWFASYAPASGDKKAHKPAEVEAFLSLMASDFLGSVPVGIVHDEDLFHHRQVDAPHNVEVSHPEHGVRSAHVTSDPEENEAAGKTLNFATIPPLSTLEEVWERAQANDVPLAVVFIDKEASPEEFEMYQKWAVEHSKEHLGRIAPAFVGSDFFERIEMLGGKQEDIPTMIITDLRKNWPFNHAEGNPTFEKLVDFAAEFLAGSLKPHFKSEPIPETQDKAVIQVVGNTFDEIVMDETKDVLLEFYAPWCGHCQALEPVYEELAEEFASRDDVVIARMDLTANDHTSDVEVRGFPTIVMFPRGGAAPVEFEGGDRSLESLVAFVNEHTAEEAPAEDVSEGEL